MTLFKRAPLWLLIAIVVLVVIRLLMPPVGKWVINKQLAEKLGTYEGHIEDFDLSLYRGAYQLQGLVIRQKDADVPPMVQIDEFDISISWKSLLKKMITSDIKITNPVIQLVDSKDPKKKQFGVEGMGETPKKPDKNQDKFGMEPIIEQWKGVSDVLMPIKIDSFEIQNGAIYFTNASFEKPLPVKLEKINFYIQDLRTQPSERMSPFALYALLQEHADINVEGDVDILTIPTKASVDFKLENLKVPTLNQILLAYVPIDVSHGSLSIYGETATAGDTAGYVKVFFKEGNVVIRKQDYHSVKHFFIEIIGGMGNWFLENNKTDTVAFEVPFSINNEKLDVNGTDAFWSAIKNKGDSLEPKIDNKISLNDIGKKRAVIKEESKKDEKSKKDAKSKKKSKSKKK